MKKKGFTLIELLVYMVIFVVLVTVFTLFVFSLVRVQAKIRINKEVLSETHRAVERMLYEIRQAQDVYQSASVFGSHPGQLSLITSYYTQPGETISFLDFYLDDNGRLSIKKEGSDGEPLTSEKIEVTNLVFNRLTVDDDEIVRIEITARYNGPVGNPFYQAATTLISSANLRND